MQRACQLIVEVDMSGLANVPAQQTKKWKIPVNRVSVRQCVIAVTACDYEEALRIAISRATDCDFRTGKEITCDYEIGEV